jgi:hypothetical protein
MLFIIGGVPRSGKSTVRKQLLERYKISGIELDRVRGMIDKAMPELGMNRDIDEGSLSEKLWPWISGLIEEYKDSTSDYFILEGEYFTPEMVVQFKDDPNCKVCFMLYSDITVEQKVDNIMHKSAYTSGWSKSYTDEEIKGFVEQYIETSHRYKKMCQLLGIEYFDTSDDFESKIEEAVQYLIGR